MQNFFFKTHQLCQGQAKNSVKVLVIIKTEHGGACKWLEHWSLSRSTFHECKKGIPFNTFSISFHWDEHQWVRSVHLNCPSRHSNSYCAKCDSKTCPLSFTNLRTQPCIKIIRFVLFLTGHGPQDSLIVGLYNPSYIQATSLKGEIREEGVGGFEAPPKENSQKVLLPKSP